MSISEAAYPASAPASSGKSTADVIPLNRHARRAIGRKLGTTIKPDAKPLPVETVTLAGSAEGKRLTKRWRRDADGNPVAEDYDHAFEFMFVRKEVAGVDGMAGLLRHLAGRPHAALLRSKLPAGPDVVQGRRVSTQFTDEPSRLLSMDFDDVELPAGMDPVGDFAGCAAWVRDNLLPIEFRGAKMAAQATSSAGFKPGFRARGFFFGDKPVAAAGLKHWLRDASVDDALYSACQLHYTASPVLAEGIADPIAERVVVVEGFEAVRVPAGLPTERSRPAKVSPEEVAEINDGRPKTEDAARALLRMCAGRAREAGEGERNMVLNKEAFKAGRAIPTLDRDDVLDVMIEAGVEAGLDDDEAEDVATRAVDDGARTPRAGVPECNPRVLFAGLIEAGDEPGEPLVSRSPEEEGKLRLEAALVEYGLVLDEPRAPVVRMSGPKMGARTSPMALADQLRPFDYQVPSDTGKGVRTVSIGKEWLHSPRRRAVSDLIWDPRVPAGAALNADGETWTLNTFRKAEHAPCDPDPAAWRAFVDLVDNVVHDEREREWVLDFLATRLRHLGTPGVALLFVNKVQGSGRGTLAQIIRGLLGTWNCNEVSAAGLQGQTAFTAFRAHKLFHEVRELNAPAGANRRGSGDAVRLMDRLKSIIDPAAVPFNYNEKNVTEREEWAFGTWMLNTNNVDALPLSAEDRRFTVLRGKDVKLTDAPGGLFGRINAYRPGGTFTAEFIAAVYAGLMAREEKPEGFLFRKLEGTIGERQMQQETADPLRAVLPDVLKDLGRDYATSKELSRMVENAMRADGHMDVRNAASRLPHALGGGNKLGWRRVEKRQNYKAPGWGEPARATVYQREGAPAFELLDREERWQALGSPAFDPMGG